MRRLCDSGDEFYNVGSTNACYQIRVAYVLFIFNPFYPRCIHYLGDSPVSEFAMPNFHFHRLFKRPKKIEKSVSETSAHEIQTPGNRPKERIQHSQHGESMK